VISPPGGKKVYSSLGKRSNLYGRSMTLDFFLSISTNGISSLMCDCISFIGKSSR
jgi:hypothetical protein